MFGSHHFIIKTVYIRGKILTSIYPNLIVGIYANLISAAEYYITMLVVYSFCFKSGSFMF